MGSFPRGTESEIKFDVVKILIFKNELQRINKAGKVLVHEAKTVVKETA